VLFSVFGQQVANLEVWKMQKVAEGLLVFGAGESTEWTAALSRHIGEVGLEERFGESCHKCGPRGIVQFG
jgi:hypothetical protein